MASTEMESKATLETSATATPAPSIRHNIAHRESIELATLNYRQSDTTIAPSAAHDATETAAESRREMIALAAVVWTQFMAGWNDGTLGPLIPRIQNYYGLGFITVSMLFVSACIGFITGAILVVHLTDRYGFGRVLITGSAFQIVVYSVLSITPPFPVMCVALMANGIGMSFQNAQTSAMVISLTKNPGLKMGILQAGYGAGACVAPLIATQFASRPRWSFYYLVSLGLAVTNTISLSYVFRFRRLPEILASFGIPEVVHTAEHSQSNKYRQILGLRVVYILAFFCLVYVGTEVTIGGWIVTFLIDTRGGGASSGYVSSGFFAGLMLGRLALIWVNHKVGERRVIYLYSALIVALEFVIWFTPSLILNAVAVSVVGLLLATPQKVTEYYTYEHTSPFYPILMNQSGSMLPAWLLTGAVSWIASSGQAGSAVFPFMTGVIAQKHGVQVMQPLIVSLVVLMSLTWAVIPRGTLGHTAYSFWGDRFNATITKAQVQTNEIVANVTSSDGANWIEMITGCYSGLPAKCPRTLWNFAFAGADIDPGILTLHHNYTIDLTEQVAQWEQARKDKLLQAPSKSSLAAFFIGINDTGDTAAWKNVTSWTAFWNTELDSYFNAVERVYQTGLRSFLFLNVPPTNRAPASLKSANAPNQKVQIAAFNSLLTGRIDSFKKKKVDVSTVLVDTNALFANVLDNASAYGFTNTTGYCQCSDPGYFWYNSGHITQRAHRLLADEILKVLEETG
ncbi:major facilitator superfamily transporter [Ceratobasidium sp. AG-Ba]|nr:major facilitator superfamily transporter [Ceratobasidium sp. AG-Ba]